jgi:NhaP-type Na+/H+ or K+/H+ antiporter
MTNHLVILASIGAIVLSMSWLPSLSKRIRISYPIILLLLGFVLFYAGVPIPWPDPFWPDYYTMCISEVIVVVSLMTAGLKIPIDKKLKFWRLPFRFIAIGMPLFMGVAFLLGLYFLNLSIASALLLAVVLAPTDPVLAAEVQLADPERQEGEPPETEFALTAEAGMNDGAAFPFTYMAVLVIQAGSWQAFDLWGWVLDEFFLKVFLGTLLGWVFAKLLIGLYKWLKESFNVHTDDGLLAFAMAIAVYAATELLHGYGFLAVFIASLTLNKSETFHEHYKQKLHSFVDQMERLILVFWVLIFGGGILNGLLGIASWEGLVFALLLIFLVRPITGAVSLLGCGLPVKEKMAISFFGIRGIGSIFYLSWAFVKIGEDYADKEYIYSVVSIIILSSIVVHGLSAPFVFANRPGSKEET